MTAVDSELVDRVRARVAAAVGDGQLPDVAAAVRAELPHLAGSPLLVTVDAVAAEVVGAGPLTPYLSEPDVSDVVVQPDGAVWVDRGGGMQVTPTRLDGPLAVGVLATRLAALAGARLDTAHPWVDGRLPDGTRLHAVLPPVGADGPAIALRTPPRRPFTLADLVASGSLPAAGVELLEALLHARLSFLVTGGTGTGKTTVLSALLSAVDPGERLVLVEDTPELRPLVPHVVRLVARPPNAEGAGAVDLALLVRQALRMRPDRLVVGEARGAEAIELLAALNTGHEGGCGTLHARRPSSVPARLEALCAAAGLDRAAAHSQVAAGLDAVVHLDRTADGGRRVRALGVVRRDRDGLVDVAVAWSFPGDGSVQAAAGAGQWRELTAT